MPSYQLEISVTEKCNLGCPYCYVANVDKFMTTEIFDKAWPEFLQLIDKLLIFWILKSPYIAINLYNTHITLL